MTHSGLREQIVSFAHNSQQFARFVIVLLIGALADLGAMNLLLWMFSTSSSLGNWAVPLASTGGFACGLASNFILHRRWTFRESEHQPIRQQLPIFVFVSLSALALRLASVTLLFPLALNAVSVVVSEPGVQRTLGANVAQIMAMGVSMLWNYYANRRWTYRAA